MSSLFSSRCSSCAAKTGPSYSTCMRNFRRVRTHCVHTLRFGCEVRAARSVCPVGPVCVLCVSSGSPGVTPGVIQISPRMITIFETGLHEHVPEVPRTHTDVGGGSEGCATPSQWSCTYLEAVRNTAWFNQTSAVGGGGGAFAAAEFMQVPVALCSKTIGITPE